jgi:hypothetical protein
VLQFELTTCVVLAVKPLQSEREQRQRILSAAGFDVGKQGIDQSIVDLEWARSAVQPPHRPFDDLGVGAFRHGSEVKWHLRNAFELRHFLQPLIVV